MGTFRLELKGGVRGARTPFCTKFAKVAQEVFEKSDTNPLSPFAMNKLDRWDALIRDYEMKFEKGRHL